jgi:glutamate dehydrogenase/leucine dehydrogenase
VRLFERFGDEYEEVAVFHDAATGLHAMVAIHSTALGPALGGTRYYPYRSEDEALEDVLRLARGMTYKSAIAGLDLGGGKAVILGDPATQSPKPSSGPTDVSSKGSAGATSRPRMSAPPKPTWTPS